MKPKPHFASNTPNAPPARASKRLSASSCRIIRQRAAPRATRTANSRERDDARASSRLAIFEHAIKSTKPIAPNSIQRVERTSATSWSCIRSTCTVELGSASPSSEWASTCWRLNTFNSVRARSRLAPRFNRANPIWAAIVGQSCGGAPGTADGLGNHTSRLANGN